MGSFAMQAVSRLIRITNFKIHTKMKNDSKMTYDSVLCAGHYALHLTLKRKWYDLIASGNKTEEYREIKDYWEKRFILDYDPINKNWNERQLPVFKSYDIVVFKNGYSKDAPTMIVELNAFSIGSGNEDWGAEKGEKYFILHLGKVLFDNALH